MDPLTALSVAVAVAQFIDFGFKIVSNTREIYASGSGATEENRSLATAALEVQIITKKLVSSRSESPTEEEKALDALVAECRSLSDQLLALLEKIRAKDPKSKIQSTLAAFKTKRYEKERLSLQKRLEQCRLRLEHLLSHMSRAETKERLEHAILYSKSGADNLTAIRSRVEELRHGVELELIGPKAREQLQELLGVSEIAYDKAA